MADTGYYLDGTVVELEATPPVRADQRVVGSSLAYTLFSGWQQLRPVVGAEVVLLPGERASVVLDRDRTVRPTYHFAGDCSWVHVESRSPGTVLASTHKNGTPPYCEAGDLDLGPAPRLLGQLPRVTPGSETPTGSFTLTAHPAEGLDPLLGWTFSAQIRDDSGIHVFADGSWTTSGRSSRTVTDAVAGTSLELPLGFLGLSATPHACQRLDATVALRREDGTWIADYATDEDSLLEVFPAPNCPFDAHAWLVGTQVEVWALGNPLGYQFLEWRGAGNARTGGVEQSALAAALGAETAEFLGEGFSPEAVITLVMDGATPQRDLEVAYAVTCFDLTVQGHAKSVSWYPEPNCPGFEGEIEVTQYPDRYLRDELGGSMDYYMAPIEKLQAAYGPRTMTGRFVGGSEVLLHAAGRSGDVWEGWSGDIATPGRVNPGTVIVDGDSLVLNHYRGKPAGEQLEDFGNDVAIAFKKGVGIASLAVAEYLKYVPPLGAVSTFADGLSLIGTILELAGVSKSDVAWLHYAKQLIDLPFSLISCGGAWGLGSATNLGSAAAYAAATAAKNQTYRITNIADANASVRATVDAMNAGDDGLLMSAKLAFYKTKLNLSRLSRVAAPVMVVGTVVYAGVTGDGIAWDSDAHSAWSDGSLYTECLRQAVPSFVHDVVDLDLHLLAASIGSGIATGTEMAWTP